MRSKFLRNYFRGWVGQGGRGKTVRGCQEELVFGFLWYVPLPQLA